MWTDLVQAYESKLAVLEEGRAAFSKAVAEVIDQVVPAMEAAVREGLGDSAARFRIDAALAVGGDDVPFASAPWSRITIADDEVGTEFRLSAWIASCWGGPPGLLRVALSLQGVHGSLDRKEWIARCGDLIEDSAPGEPFDPLDSEKFAESSPDWPDIRIASVGLADRDLRQATKEARDITQTLAEAIVPMMGSIREAGLALTRAEGALLRYRPTLEARAAEVDQPVYPARGLGPWQGGVYLQAGSFWLATNPDTNELLAAAKDDEEVVESLGEKLSRSIGRRAGRMAVVLLEEEQLRDSQHDIDAAVAQAFDVWFDTKAGELGASSEGGPG